jgi:dolichol-phosphate mannosyltransferase
MSVELTVIVPTFNEKENIKPLIKALKRVLKDIKWEIIFVDDDSCDGTADVVRDIAIKDYQVRGIQRIGRRGLTSSCVEGILASSTPYVAVMDVDMQHDEKLLSVMLKTLKETDIDIVVGSRYVKGGSTGGLNEARTKASRLAIFFSTFLMKKNVLADSMSGFFMFKRPFFDRVVRKMSGKGFKILLDMFTAADFDFKYKELPYKMRSRKRGESKLDIKVMLDFLYLLVDRVIGKYIPIRFLLFVLVGCSGLLFHLAILYIMHDLLKISFFMAHLTAIIVAMTNNFIVNNIFTYRDRKLKGLKFVYGLITFYVACSIGAFINLQLAYNLYKLLIPWYMAGLIGAGVGAIWNYALTSTITWQKKLPEKIT